MNFELKMPDLSTTGSPIKIVRWLVAVGESVERGQAVLDVETDKATMEVEALNSGMLVQQIVQAGQEASAGDLLALFGTGEPLQQSSASAYENGSDKESRTYPRDFLLSLYRRMILIRQFEDRVKSLFLEGIMPGTIHQCQGQEATAVGVCAALERSDFITSAPEGQRWMITYHFDLIGCRTDKQIMVIGILTAGCLIIQLFWIGPSSITIS